MASAKWYQCLLAPFWLSDFHIISFLVLQKQQALTGEQASLLDWFTDKMADVACEQQLQAQHSPPRQQVILIRMACVKSIHLICIITSQSLGLRVDNQLMNARWPDTPATNGWQSKGPAQGLGCMSLL